MAKVLHLVHSDICEALLKSDPFAPFKGDCTSCYLFRTTPMSSDGWCMLRGLQVGHGYTCRSHGNGKIMQGKKLEALKKLNRPVIYK